MDDFLEPFLRSMNVPDKLVVQFSNEFAGIVFMNILGRTFPKLGRHEEEQLAGYFRENKMTALWDFLKAKYTADEWENLLRKEITPVVDSYLKEVIANPL